FLEAAATFAPAAGRAAFLGDGAVPGGFFATPWRLEHGALLDLGPHVLDALDAALGPIVAVEARGDPHGVVALTCGHAGGEISQAMLSVTTPARPSGLVVELYGPGGRLAFDATVGDREDVAAAMATLTAELAGAVRTGTSGPLSVQ